MRALCKALGQDWDTVYVGLSVYGFSLSDMQVLIEYGARICARTDSAGIS